MQTKSMREPAKMSQGFTLIELLIVVAVISLLAALLLPSLKSARERARMVQCMANMHQIYVLSETFRVDTGFMLPSWYYPKYPDGFPAGFDATKEPLGQNIHFGGMLVDYGYLPSNSATRALFRCPSGVPFREGGEVENNLLAQNYPPNDRRRLMNTGELNKGASYAKYQSSSGWGYTTGYAINMNAGSGPFYHDTTVNQGCYPRTDFNGKYAEIVYIMESNRHGATETDATTAHAATAAYKGGSFGLYANPATQEDLYGYGPAAFHMGSKKSNIVYADGHMGVMLDDYRDPARGNTQIPFPFKWGRTDGK
ncbi:MAG: prepilin-type N-terminal cleavage/methylation domain-containing protein [Verrucomicrobiae bacterium]|nr:prepilin-type N-terminal cleavage/methylation domain-containing protein [Verrucomicrobiae bacterium]